MIIAIIVTFILAGCLIGFEWILPRTTLPLPWQRKIIHVSMCLAVIGFSFMLPYQWFLPIGLFFTILLVVLRKIRPLVSLADRHDTSYGELFLPLGIALTAPIAQSLNIFQITILLLGLADTAAYIIGTSFASPRLIFQKTLAGSTAYILTAVIIVAVFRPLPIALAIGSVVGIIELISPKGSDNLTTPLAAALLLGAV